MTLPRLLKPDTTYLVTRRCLERRFRLRPEQAVNDLLDYLIGYAALQSGVEIVAMVAMSSHLHFVLHDPDTGLADFMERLGSLSARALNVLHGQVGQMWEAGSYSAVPLETRGEIVEKIAYVLANPTKAGLVATPEEWPGLITHVDSLGRGMRPVKRPGYFFREDGEERRQGERDQRPSGWSDTPLPGAVVWELALPPGFDDADELQRQVKVALEEKLAKIHTDRRRTGKRAFLGAKRVQAQSILDTPASTEELFRLNPRLAFRDWTRRAQACSGWLAFQFGYRAALKDYREGNHEAEFPFGTYAMRVRFGVRCSSGAGA